MGWTRGEEPQDEEYDEVRRPSLVDGIEMELNSPQLAPTSLKYLDLNNPLRRQCIRITLSP